MKSRIPIALTIAGSDSGGGAGIQADLKAFSALNVYGASVLTALTAQNTRGVSAIHAVPPEFVRAQMDAVFDDLAVDAVKIGMLADVSVIAAVRQGLDARPTRPVVLDPVMVAESGDPLLADNAANAIVEQLFPLATLITPNLHEAAHLLGESLAQDEAAMERQAKALQRLGAANVLVKGGHASLGDHAADVLVTEDGLPQWFTAPLVETKNTHGTGCSLSSAIAAHLAFGAKLPEAVSKSKEWLTGALQHANELDVGKGAGPVNHFHALWEKRS